MKSKDKEFLFWLSISVIVCILLSWKLFLSREVVLEFHNSSKYPVEYKLYFLNKSDAMFDEKNKLAFAVKEGDSDVNVTIPLEKKSLWRVKLVIEKTKSDVITISNLKLKGKQVVNTSEFDAFDFYGFMGKNVKNLDKPLILDRNSNEHYFSIFERIDSVISIDYYTLFVLLLIYTIILHKFIGYLLNYKRKQGFSRIDVVFLAVFFFVIWLPMMSISDEEKSITENRMLEKKPEFSFNNLSGYGQKFNAWFSDRFWGKSELQGIYHDITGKLSSWGNDLVLIGENNWLFWKGENSLENFQNITYLTDKEMQGLSNYLSSIDEWARKNGKEFYYFIAPDKNKVYGENISVISKLKPDEENRTRKIIDYLNKNTRVNAHYLGDALVKNKDNGLLFWKHDTHWSRLGAYIGYKEMMNFISKFNKNVQSVNYKTISYKMDDPKDLENFLPSAKKENVFYPVPEVDENLYSCKKNSGGVHCVNPNKLGRVYMFRDSFTENLLPYLASTFGEIYFVWKYSVTPDDLDYIMKKADIIIFENGERMIPRLLPFTFPEK